MFESNGKSDPSLIFLDVSVMCKWNDNTFHMATKLDTYGVDVFSNK